MKNKIICSLATFAITIMALPRLFAGTGFSESDGNGVKESEVKNGER